MFTLENSDCSSALSYLVMLSSAEERENDLLVFWMRCREAMQCFQMNSGNSSWRYESGRFTWLNLTRYVCLSQVFSFHMRGLCCESDGNPTLIGLCILMWRFLPVVNRRELLVEHLHLIRNLEGKFDDDFSIVSRNKGMQSSQKHFIWFFHKNHENSELNFSRTLHFSGSTVVPLSRTLYMLSDVAHEPASEATAHATLAIIV